MITNEMEFAEYRAIDAINASVLVKGKTSMLHMHHAANEGDSKETPAMRWGKIVHAAILEPERFADSMTVWKGSMRAGSAWDECLEGAPDVELILTADELAKVLAMQAVVHAHPRARDRITKSNHESVVTWQDDCGTECKARLDIVAPSVNGIGGFVADYKTTRDPTPAAFFRSAYNLSYHLRMGWYVRGVEKATGDRLPVYMIVQESDAPFDCWVCTMPASIVRQGEDEAVELLRHYRASVVTGVFPGVVGQEVIDYELPAWAMPAEVNMEGLSE